MGIVAAGRRSGSWRRLTPDMRLSIGLRPIHWNEALAEDLLAYLEFLLKWHVIPQKLDMHDVITNDRVADIKKFDAHGIEV